LLAGQSFRVALPRGLELTLTDRDKVGTWQIGVGPADEPTINFYDVTPPLQWRPHTEVGAGYMAARESVGFPRRESIVVTRAEYDAAVAAIRRPRRPESGETLETLASLSRGRLLLKVDAFDISPAGPVPSAHETLEWISVSGEVCVP
jgi:hypothetical protein